MSREWDRELLNELRDIFIDAGMAADMESINGTDVLVTEAFDNYGDSAPEDCTVSVEHLTEDSTEILLLYSLRTGLDEKQSQDILSLVGYLNKYLTLGNFGLSGDGYFWFSCSFVIDESVDRKKLMKIITAALSVTEQTVVEAIEITAPVLNGEKPVSELMNEDTVIVQF